MGMTVSASEALKILSIRSKKSLAKISEELGFKQRASLVQMISRGSIRMRLGAAVAEACGYKMVLVPKDVDVSEVDGIEIKGEVDIE